MHKSGILMIATMLAAGISSVSAADINFDGGGLAAGNLREMVAGSTGIEAAEASEPALIPMIEPWNIEGAPFMNEQACSILDANFFVQPGKEEAVEMLQPCLAALSGKYQAALRLVPGDIGLNLLVGDAKNPGTDLQAALQIHLKVKANGQFFGHRVVLYAPSARASANKGWLDDAETVYNAVTEDPAGTAALVVAAIEHAAEDQRPANGAVCMTPHDDRPITSSMSW